MFVIYYKPTSNDDREIFNTLPMSFNDTFCMVSAVLLNIYTIKNKYFYQELIVSIDFWRNYEYNLVPTVDKTVAD